MQSSNFDDWPFLSVHFWGEKAEGLWTLEVINAGSRHVNTPGEYGFFLPSRGQRSPNLNCTFCPVQIGGLRVLLQVKFSMNKQFGDRFFNKELIEEFGESILLLTG